MPPDNEFIVLDAGSSQQCAIANVLAGQNALIHGLPGTGKSRTIANIVATLAATGHRVLFVAEKRAGLEAVLLKA
jgi:predicted ATP-dependent serine protease